MKTQLTVLIAAVVLFSAGCFPDVGEGKARAAVSDPAAATEKVAAKPEANAEKPRTIEVDTSNSKIAAVGAKVTRKHDIAFDEWDGTLEVTGNELTGIDIEIQMTSIRADVEKLTGHLKSPDFFDVAKFPKASFKSTKIVAKKGADGATHEITGNMTMHGVTKQLSFPATVAVNDGEVDARADFVIDREDFGITYPGMPNDLIKDDVALTINLVGSPSDA